jgi:hypothetical protein
MNKNQTKALIALVTLLIVIIVPGVIVWKVFFTASDTGVITVHTTTPAGQPAQVAAVAPMPNPPPPRPAAVGPGPRTVGPRVGQPRVPGALPIISDVLPGDLAPGPAAAGGGPVTAAMRRDYLNKLWSSANAEGGRYSRGTDMVYQTAKGTVLPTTQPVDPSVTATLVTVHASGTLWDVLEAVAEQGHIRIASQQQGLFASTDAAIKIDADQAPLMEVLGEVCAQAALAPTEIDPPDSPLQTNGSTVVQPPGRVIFSSQQPRQTLGPWIVCGPFAYMIDQITHYSPINTQYSGGIDTMVSFNAVSEPKLRVLVGPGNLTITEAVDDKGLSLLPNNGQPMQMYSQGVDWTQQRDQPRQINLQCPAGFGHTIVRLRGVDHCLVQAAGRSLNFHIAPGDKPFVVILNGMRIELSVNPQIAQQYGDFSLPYTVTYHRGSMPAADWASIREGLAGVRPSCYDAADAELMFQQTILPQNQQIMVREAPGLFSRIVAGLTGGAPRERLVVENQGGDDADTVTRTYVFSRQDNRGGRRTADHLVLDMPTKVIAVDVPFAFDNLPLP